MSGSVYCKCPEQLKPIKDRRWGVIDRHCNHSAFNGYRWTPSDYSAIAYPECLGVWRTKAAYVDYLRDCVVTADGWAFPKARRDRYFTNCTREIEN